MAKQTDPALAQKMIYSVFPRNHSKEGTLKRVIDDLDRIASLGTDILWLMPIYPIGKEKRKGKDGSPYAIADYRSINPETGSWQDLERLVKEAHKRSMKVIVDIVFNHTSPDSKLVQNHPEWFYHDENGHPHSLHKEWSDIVDLDYSHPALRAELIDTLKQYAKVVDGFRCDVASRVPVSFWKDAREACQTVNPDLFWLAESCHLPFVKFCRDHGRVGESDSALYEAFDVLYDYDAFPYFEKIVKENAPMSEWVDALIRQDAALPCGAIKLRYLENHDTDRIAQYVKDPLLWKNWTALQFCLKGLPMIYHGQEQRESHRPSIFDQDVIDWKEDEEAENWIRAMNRVHKTLFLPEGPIEYFPDLEQNVLKIERDGKTGWFVLGKDAEGRLPQKLKVSLKDGVYQNLLDGRMFSVQNGQIDTAEFPLLVDDAADKSREGR